MDTQFTSQPRAAARPTKSQATHINRFLALRAYRVHTLGIGQTIIVVFVGRHGNSIWAAHHRK